MKKIIALSTLCITIFGFLLIVIAIILGHTVDNHNFMLPSNALLNGRTNFRIEIQYLGLFCYFGSLPVWVMLLVFVKAKYSITVQLLIKFLGLIVLLGVFYGSFVMYATFVLKV